MIKSKAAIIGSAMLLCICIVLFFPFPNNQLLGARTTFMSFPISNQDGYNVLGIIGSALFIIAILLLVKGLKKYHFRTIVISIFVYSLLPILLITMYQETLASGIFAISYDGNGQCQFKSVGKDLLNGVCNVELDNHSNEAVTFELKFSDSFNMEDGVQMESLMNLAGPFRITVDANRKKSVSIKGLLDVSNVPKHIGQGESSYIHIMLIDGEAKRNL